MYRLQRILSFLVFLCSLLAFVHEFHYFLTHLRYQQAWFLLVISGLLSVSMLYGCLQVDLRLEFVLSTFLLIAAWRLSFLAHLPPVEHCYLWAFIGQFIIFIQMIRVDHLYPKVAEQLMIPHLSSSAWHLLFIRMFIGYDLIPHFCEKLFAGSVYRGLLVHDFWSLGVPHAQAMVILSGLCEFLGALSISCGLFTRVGAIGLSTYLFIATSLGHHFSKGFIWADVGGGWEFPVFWLSLILSFSALGAGRFSIDGFLAERFYLPCWLSALMGHHPKKVSHNN